MEAAPTVPHVSEEEAKAARLSPLLVQSLRRRLCRSGFPAPCASLQRS